MLYCNSKRVEAERMSAEIIVLKDRILGYQETVKGLQSSLKSAEDTKAKQKESYEAVLVEKDAIIKELKNKLAHASAVAERNGANTGIPTAATPINKKKVIPNTRRDSGKQRGGQPGHERHTLSGFDGTEITDTKEHGLDLSLERCDVCQGELIDTGETESKDEFDVKVTVVKRRHNFPIYKCVDCGARVRMQIELVLKEANQYGGNLTDGNWKCCNKQGSYAGKWNDFWRNESKRRFYLQTIQKSILSTCRIYGGFEASYDPANHCILG